jgi:hypothetical protein
MLGGSLVTTAWRVLRLRMEETANILKKQSRTADKGWYFSFQLFFLQYLPVLAYLLSKLCSFIAKHILSYLLWVLYIYISHIIGPVHL